jgi:hypothetical protein
MVRIRSTFSPAAAAAASAPARKTVKLEATTTIKKKAPVQRRRAAVLDEEEEEQMELELDLQEEEEEKSDSGSDSEEEEAAAAAPAVARRKAPAPSKAKAPATPGSFGSSEKAAEARRKAGKRVRRERRTLERTLFRHKFTSPLTHDPVLQVPMGKSARRMLVKRAVYLTGQEQPAQIDGDAVDMTVNAAFDALHNEVLPRAMELQLALGKALPEGLSLAAAQRYIQEKMHLNSKFLLQELYRYYSSTDPPGWDSRAAFNAILARAQEDEGYAARVVRGQENRQLAADRKKVHARIKVLEEEARVIGGESEELAGLRFGVLQWRVESAKTALKKLKLEVKNAEKRVVKTQTVELPKLAKRLADLTDEDAGLEHSIAHTTSEVAEWTGVVQDRQEVVLKHRQARAALERDLIVEETDEGRKALKEQIKVEAGKVKEALKQQTKAEGELRLLKHRLEMRTKAVDTIEASVEKHRAKVVQDKLAIHSKTNVDIPAAEKALAKLKRELKAAQQPEAGADDAMDEEE